MSGKIASHPPCKGHPFCRYNLLAAINPTQNTPKYHFLLLFLRLVFVQEIPFLVCNRMKPFETVVPSSKATSHRFFFNRSTIRIHEKAHYSLPCRSNTVFILKPSLLLSPPTSINPYRIHRTLFFFNQRHINLCIHLDR